ncbi:MAG TPA: hypothetical protein DIU00_03240, partial [Phycisphaerales bacterium]|nr:hypothetical protein [Phycisphaerales bacterium]
GIVQPVPTESILGAQEYTIVEANSVEGEFDTVDTALLDLGILLSDASLGYEPNLVTLDINAKRFDDPSIVKSDNQSSLGGALQKITEGGGNSITTALQGLESADDVRDAYKQLSGQIRPQLMPVASVDASKFMGVVSDRMNPTNQGLSYFGPGSGPLLAMANPDATNDNRSMSDTSPNFAVGNGTAKFSDQKLGFWGKGYGIFGDRDSGGGVSGYDYTIYGTSFGLDYQITDSSLLGITVGYSESNMDSSLSGNKGDISSNHIGIYGNKNTEDWHFDSILACSFLEYETKRYVNFVNERLDGDTDGQGISGYVEARYDWRNLDRWLLQPLASFQFSLLDIDSYTEDGCHGCETGDTSSLGFDSQRYDSYKGSLGLKMTKNIFNQSNENRANIQLRGRWVHEFGDDNSSVDAHFASDPGAVFKVSDEDIDRDSFILGAGINADLGRHTRFSFGYDTQLNSDDNMHLLSAMFMYRW